MNNYGETLYHHGIKGQKWGLRKYQNEDGSLTAAGREHYGYGQARAKYEAQKMIYKSAKKDARNAHLDAYAYNNRHPISKLTNKNVAKKLNQKQINAAMYERASKEAKENMKAAKQEYKNSDEYKARQEKIKKAAIAGAAVAATALAVYGAYKISEATKKKAYNLSIERGRSAASDIVDRLSTEYIRTNMKGGQQSLRSFERSFEADNENTARYNSKNLKSAINYLHGSGRRTTAELEKSGIKTMDINRDLSDELDLMRYRRLRANDELENVKRYNNYTKEVRRINGKKYK